MKENSNWYNKEKFKEQKGITLIALVVTLVVLLILAGITLNLLFGETGIFNRAKQSEDAYKIGALKDQISTIILDWEIEKKIPNETNDETVGTLEGLWDKFVDADIIDNPEEDIYHQEGTDIYEVTTNEGYVVEIIVKEDGTVEIGDIVKGDNLPPRIGEITSSGTSNSIHVEVNITRSTGEVKVSYYYKKDGEKDSSYKLLKENVADLTADFTGLEQNVIYNIKVIVTDDNGSAEKVINERTGELTQATIEQVGDLEWNNRTATIKLQIGEGVELANGEKLVYQVGDIDGEWLEYPKEGISSLEHGEIVYAAISDGINVSKESSFKIEDNIAPNAPTISITSGTKGNNNYYKSNVTITITAGSDGESGANKIRYKVTGAQTINETTTTEGTTSATITIATDGTSTITAYTLDKAENVSTAKTQVVYKDSTAPSTASLTVGTVEKTSIAVTAKGADSTSGIYSYQFQRSTTSSTSGFTTVATQTSTLTNYSYTYTGLTEGTTYYLRVLVTDRAGNTRTSSVVTQATASKNVANTLKEGDYVTYEDNYGTRRKCIVMYGPENTNYTSYGIQIITDDTVETVTLGYDDTLVSGSTRDEKAMNSYNSAINTLNSRASTYLNTKYASDARCVGSVPNSKNSQSSYYTFTEISTSYSGKLRDTDENYQKDWTQMGKLGIRDSSSNAYWLASRLVTPSTGSGATFSVRYAWGADYVDKKLIFSHVTAGNDPYSKSSALRPVFTLKPEIKITGGSGTENNPYTLGV